MNIFSKTLAALLLALAFTGAVQASERININSADVATLDRVMDGVGPAKAAAIIEHRRLHGPFRTVDQLVNVKGIGPATLERNRGRIMVAGAPPTVRAATNPAQPAARPAAPAPRVN